MLRDVVACSFFAQFATENVYVACCAESMLTQYSFCGE
jgi:hypothetical protein